MQVVNSAPTRCIAPLSVPSLDPSCCLSIYQIPTPVPSSSKRSPASIPTPFTLPVPPDKCHELPDSKGTIGLGRWIPILLAFSSLSSQALQLPPPKTRVWRLHPPSPIRISPLIFSPESLVLV